MKFSYNVKGLVFLKKFYSMFRVPRSRVAVSCFGFHVEVSRSQSFMKVLSMMSFLLKNQGNPLIRLISGSDVFSVSKLQNLFQVSEM